MSASDLSSLAGLVHCRFEAQGGAGLTTPLLPAPAGAASNAASGITRSSTAAATAAVEASLAPATDGEQPADGGGVRRRQRVDKEGPLGAVVPNGIQEGSAADGALSLAVEEAGDVPSERCPLSRVCPHVLQSSRRKLFVHHDFNIKLYQEGPLQHPGTFSS